MGASGIVCMGAVKTPSTVKATSSQLLGEVIGKADGLVPNAADTGKIYVRRPSSLDVVGDWMPHWRDTVINPGDLVYVPWRPISAIVFGEVWGGPRIYWDPSGITRGAYNKIEFGTNIIDHPCLLRRVLSSPRKSVQSWLQLIAPLKGFQADREIVAESGCILLVPPHQGGQWAEPVAVNHQGLLANRPFGARALPDLTPPTMAPNHTPATRESVVILGEVRNPGPQRSIDRGRLADYIKGAGGLTSQADSKIIISSPSNEPVFYDEPEKIRALHIEAGSTVAILRTSMTPFAIVLGDVGGEPLLLGGERLPGEDLVSGLSPGGSASIHDVLTSGNLPLPSTLSALLVVHRFGSEAMTAELMHEAEYRRTPIRAGDLVIVPSAKDLDGLRTQLACFQRQIPKIAHELQTGEP